jgi:hypothetical protein
MPIGSIFHINKAWDGIIILELPVRIKRSDELGSAVITLWLLQKRRESSTKLEDSLSDPVIFRSWMYDI